MFRRLSAPRLIVLGFAAFMGLGALLLKLPASTYGGISWVDALLVLLCSFVCVRSSSCFALRGSSATVLQVLRLPVNYPSSG